MHNCQNLACIQNRQKTANFIAAGLLDYNPLSEAIKISEHLFQNHLLCLRYPNRSKLDEQYFCICDLIDLIRKIVFGAFSNGQIDHSHVDLPIGRTRTYTIFMATFSQPVGSFIRTLSTVHVAVSIYRKGSLRKSKILQLLLVWARMGNKARPAVPTPPQVPVPSWTRLHLINDRNAVNFHRQQFRHSTNSTR